MIDLFFQIVFNNVCISLALAIIAAIVGITLKRPVITHLLWLLVFVKLLTPPFLLVSVSQNQWMGETYPPVNFSMTEQTDMKVVGDTSSGQTIDSSPDTVSVTQIQGKHWLLVVWVIGSMVVFIWSTLQVYRFHRLLKKESEPGSPEIKSAAWEIATCLGLKSVPAIHTTSANISPMVWWVGGKVWVVIPVSLINQMTEKQLRWIVSHELAHVSRRDYMIRWIEWLVCVCFWWNPVTWWARYNLRINEELCCDALVLSSMKLKPYTYGDSLLKAVELLSFPIQQPLAIASGINNGGLLKRRVKMIVSNDLMKSKLRWLQVCIMLVALIVLPLGLTNAQQDFATAKPAVGDESNKTQPQDIDMIMAISNELSSKNQLQEIDENIAGIKARIDETEVAIEEYRSKVEETPRREEELRIYREKHMGSLPEQHDANLSMLEKLTTQLEQDNSNLRYAEIRRAAIVQHALASETQILQESSVDGQTPDESLLPSLKTVLANLRTRFTENHLDVIRLRETIAVLEKEGEQAYSGLGLTWDVTDLPSLKTVLANLQTRYTDNHPEVIRLKGIIAMLEKERDQTSINEAFPKLKKQQSINEDDTRPTQGKNLEGDAAIAPSAISDKPVSKVMSAGSEALGAGSSQKDVHGQNVGQSETVRTEKLVASVFSTEKIAERGDRLENRDAVTPSLSREISNPDDDSFKEANETKRTVSTVADNQETMKTQPMESVSGESSEIVSTAIENGAKIAEKNSTEMLLNSPETSSSLSSMDTNNETDGKTYPASEVDTPPKILRALLPKYPYVAKRDNLTGRITLQFVVTKEGSAVDAQVIRSDPPEVKELFAEAALKAVEQYHFKPATKDGKAVDVSGVNLPISFNLTKKR